ncbi:MAG: TFIIB-type zinc finger domain-containing protein [Lachnospiraceae bacterium]|nr:TFIIB-type zinc finger domain-containing protein [Lachnospiraceae bacterium]
MTLEAYLNPDFGRPQKIVFFLLALAGIIVCVILITLGRKLSVASLPKEQRKTAFYERAHGRVQLFYEMIISGASVMSFSCSYVIINHVYSLILSGEGTGDYSAFVSIWENGRDFILLLLICLSCVLNTILDRLVIPLKKIDHEDKASVRLLGMFYVILILVFLNIIGDESEYNPVMMYYLGLMVGRFVYFDASFADFLAAIKKAFQNISLLILGLLLTAGLSVFGFKAEYLLERNYYIVGIFYTHLFMLAAIFLLHHSHILQLLIRAPKNDTLNAPAENANPQYQAAGPGFNRTVIACDTCECYRFSEDDGTYYCVSNMSDEDYDAVAANHFTSCPWYMEDVSRD